MTPHTKAYTEECKGTDEKILLPISETVLYTAVNISLYVYTVSEAQTNRLVYICHSQPHTEITSGSRSKNGGKKLGEDFSFLLGIILFCVDFYNEIHSYIAYVQKQKVKTDSILVGTRDITPRNTPVASHKQLIDGIAPHITCSASEPKLCPPGENVL